MTDRCFGQQLLSVLFCLMVERQHHMRTPLPIIIITKNCLCSNKRYLMNGYPAHVIEKFLLKQSPDRRQRAQPTSRLYLRFPFINDTFANQVRTTLRSANFSFQILPIFVNNPPLKTLLKRNTNTTCGRHCLCNNKNVCIKKNVVYHIQCNICNANYIGETMRTMRKRISEHMYAESNSFVYEHFMEAHGRRPSRNDIDVSIMLQEFGTALEREEAEQMVIQKLKPSINIMHNS